MPVAGLDLSVTGLIVLTSVVIAQVAVGQNSLILPGLLLSLGFGALIGLANGLLITKRNVPPFCGDARHAGADSRRAERLHSGRPQRRGAERPETAQCVARPAAGLVRHWIAFTALLAFVLSMTPFGRRVYVLVPTVRRLGCRAFP